MATNINNLWPSTSASNLVSTSTLPFQINSGSNVAISVDPLGNTVIDKLVLKDEKTGRNWQLKVYNGELIIEPLDIIDKRDVKIKKILDYYQDLD